MLNFRLIFASFTILLLASTNPGMADEAGIDKHADYYYPSPEVSSEYLSRGAPIPEVGRTGRIAFIVGFATGEEKLGYERPWDIFVKGSEAEKLIIVAKEDGRLNCRSSDLI